MPFRHGKNTKVLSAEYDISSYLNESSTSESVETGETTTYNTTGGAKTYVVGLRDSTISMSGFFDGAASAVDEIMATAVGAGDRVITFGPEGLAVGRRVTSLNAIETSYEVSSPVADVVAISFEGQTNERLDRGISLIDLAAVSSTANGTSQDNAAATANGGAANLHVTANTRNGNTTFKVQHSADNSTWVDLITFSVVGSTTKTSERKTVTGTVNRYIRVQHTLAGSTGSITYHANFARR
jgi:hypothetical protein